MEAVVWGTVKLEVRARVDAVVCRAEEHCRVGHRRVLALELLLKVGIRRANEVFEPSKKCVEPSVCQAEAIAYQIEGLSPRFEPKVRARWRTGERKGASLGDELRHTRDCGVCAHVVCVCGVRVIMCMRRRAHLGLHRLGRRCHALVQLDHAFPQLVGQLLEKADAQQLRRAVCTLGYASGQDA